MTSTVRRPLRPRAGRVAALALLLSAAARADVHVVDPLGGDGSAQLAAALAAAQPGDVVLLRSGVYPAATTWVLDKGLTLQADVGHDVLITPGITCLPPAGGPAVLLRGLRCLVPPQSDALAALHVAGGAPTWAEDCTFTGRDGYVHPVTQFHWPPTPGVISSGLAQFATFVRCTAEGGDGLNGQTGAEGIGVLGKAVVQDCTCTGGDGGAGAGFPPLGLDGGAGLLAGSGLVRVDGGLHVGGAETDPSNPQAQSGPGLHVSLGITYVRAATFLGGPATPPGVQGPGVAVESFGFFSESPAPLPRAIAPSPVREGEQASLLFAGPQGSALFAVLGAEPATLLVPAKSGTWLIGSPYVVLYVGQAPACCAFTPLDVQMPALPPGVESVRLFLQSWAAQGAGGTFAGTGTSMVWLDAAF